LNWILVWTAVRSNVSGQIFVLRRASGDAGSYSSNLLRREVEIYCTSYVARAEIYCMRAYDL
jgi:hypothetical protein